MKRIISLLLALTLLVGIVPTAFAGEESGYTVSFTTDGHATVDVYYTQDYTTASEINVTTAVARNSDTGEVDTSKDGQVNFKVNVAEGYEIASVAADTNYKNLKDSADTGVEGIYRLTKVSGPVTVTITTKSTGSGEPEETAQAPFTEGFENESASLALAQIGRYNSGMTNADGGVMEIVDYNKTTGYAYAVNGQSGFLAAISLKSLSDSESDGVLSAAQIDVKALVEAEDSGFSYGDMTSVAVSPDGKTLAAAIQAEGYADNGRVVLFTCNEDGTLAFEKAIETGVQPDMVTFTPDGRYILTANEGEPRMGYGEGSIDPAGSVTIIETRGFTANTVGFESYNSQRDALVNAGIVLKKDTAPSVDLEPEYIACTNTTAYVSLQEANAIAVLNLASGTVTGIYSLGTVDYSQVKIDLNRSNTPETKTYTPKNYTDVLGLRMPDGISVYEAGGKTYLLTANEGDSRDWENYCNEAEDKLTATDNTKTEKKVTYLDSSDYDGLQEGKTYLFGSRSFSLFEVTGNGLVLVYDSAEEFESRTNSYLPDFFNCSNDDLEKGKRCSKKGPEPETVVTGTIKGRTYAFVTLERIGGVMVYDITDPANVSYVNYINSRDFSADVAADDSPEGLKFIPAAYSPTGKALLLAACEVGGTVAVYELTSTVEEPEPEPEPESPAVPVIPSYRVTLPADLTGGTVTLNRTYAIAGSTVTITVTPEEGFALESLTVTDAKGSELPLTDLGEGKYSFRMPSGKVTVTAEFAEIEQPIENPFEDVTAEDYYYDAVLWAVKQGITEGDGDSTFSPEKTCTRAEIVTFLWRAAGSPEPKTQNLTFTDVSQDEYYYKAVLWALENGITLGTSDTTFSPEEPCTRAQGLTMLWRAMQAPEAAAADSFLDVAADAYYAEAVQWAVAQDVTNGTGPSTFSPDADCTRAQIVTFLWRAMGR